MINDFAIKRLNGEDILYLYFDFDYEFASLDKGEKKHKLGDLVRDFIKRNNIKFSGKKIAIISGGLLIATVLLKGGEMHYNASVQNSTNNYPNSVLVMETSYANEDELPELPILAGDAPVEVSSPVETPTKVTTTKKENSPVRIKESVNVSETIPEKKQETIVDNNLYVTVNRSNGTILNLELEEYIVGVVGAEMPASFNVEALKAQAVLARTYALKSLSKGDILTDNSSTQNYKSDDELKAMWGSSFNTYYNKIRNAVISTKGMYLTYNEEIIEAVYHSTSNGVTEDASYVWGNSFPYLVSVSSPYDNSNSSFIKETFITYEDLTLKFGFLIDEDTEMNVLSKTLGDRVENVMIGSNTYSGVMLRNMLGLRSADFDIRKTDLGVYFTTRGFGHGVGMSQYGANGLAKNGANFETILKHYYTGVDINQK